MIESLAPPQPASDQSLDGFIMAVGIVLHLDLAKWGQHFGVPSQKLSNSPLVPAIDWGWQCPVGVAPCVQSRTFAIALSTLHIDTTRCFQKFLVSGERDLRDSNS